jgi:hypothetical protein
MGAASLPTPPPRTGDCGESPPPAATAGAAAGTTRFRSPSANRYGSSSSTPSIDVSSSRAARARDAALPPDSSTWRCASRTAERSCLRLSRAWRRASGSGRCSSSKRSVLAASGSFSRRSAAADSDSHTSACTTDPAGWPDSSLACAPQQRRWQSRQCDTTPVHQLTPQKNTCTAALATPRLACLSTRMKRNSVS